MFLPHVAGVLKRTDWSLLRDQKLNLLLASEENPDLEGLINFLDAVQDAAYDDGFDVIFLEEKDEESEGSEVQELLS